MDRVSQVCDNYDLTISTNKTDIVYQPAPGKPYSEPTITVNGQRLQVVDKFNYLRSTLSRAVHIYYEVTARVAKASVAFDRLLGNAWDRNRIRLGFNTFIWKWSSAQPGARRREGCCICHYLSWTDTIKPSLLFSDLDAVFAKDLFSDYLAQCLHSCGTPNPIICKWDLDTVPTPCQKT